jgi:hypothetical protein
MHCVVETPLYVRAAKDVGLTEGEQHRITVFLSENPESGDVIPGTGGARKVRFPMRGRGKSGGARIVTFYSGVDVPVFLLDIYVKGERIDLTQAERNALKTILTDTAESYRRSVRERVVDFGRSKA